MIQFIKKIFTSDVETKGISTPSNSSSFWEFLKPGVSGAYNDSNSTEYYRSYIYSCAKLNAQSIANGKFKILSDIKPKASKFKSINQKSLVVNNFDELFDVTDHPVLNLFRKPNEIDTAYSFLFKIGTYLELTGDAYVYIVKDSQNIPIKLYILQSQYVSIDSLGGDVQKYHYGASMNGTYQYSFNPDEIIHIKYFDPQDAIYGISPLAACAQSQDLINAMNVYETALNKNLGIPAGILKYADKTIKTEDRELIEKKWQNKFASVGRAGKLLVTDANVSYENIGVTSREMQFLDGRKWSREEIFACYGIPQALVLNESVNRANMDTSIDIYNQYTIAPKMKLIAEGFTNFIQQYGINGKNLYFDFVTPQREKTHEEKLANVSFLLDRNLIDNETALDMLKE